MLVWRYSQENTVFSKRKGKTEDNDEIPR